MDIQLTSAETKRLLVNFNVGGKKVSIDLNKNSDNYQLTILRGGHLTVGELITICNLIYTKKVLNESDRITICFKNSEPTCICGNEDLTTAILKTLKIELS